MNVVNDQFAKQRNKLISFLYSVFHPDCQELCNSLVQIKPTLVSNYCKWKQHKVKFKTKRNKKTLSQWFNLAKKILIMILHFKHNLLLNLFFFQKYWSQPLSNQMTTGSYSLIGSHDRILIKIDDITVYAYNWKTHIIESVMHKQLDNSWTLL